MREDAPQTFKNINGPTRENLEEILAVFRKKIPNPNWWQEQNTNSSNSSLTQQTKS